MDGTNESSPQKPSEPPVSEEITLRDGESVSFTAPDEGTAHIVVNVVPPQRSTGFFGSCLQGCGCLVLIIVILSALGSVIR